MGKRDFTLRNADGYSGIEMLFVTGLLVFSEPLLKGAERWLGKDWLFPNGLAVLFWVSSKRESFER